MLKGTQFGTDRNFFWIQTNNATEYIIRAIKRDLAQKLRDAGVPQAVLDLVKVQGYLESCGAEEVTNACANLLGPRTPSFAGVFPGWRGPQLDDVVMLCFSDPNNAAEMQKALTWFQGDDVMENRYIQLHPIVARMVFGITAEWKQGRTYDEIYAAVEGGDSVGVLLPGHYVSAGVVDDVTQELRIKDSWPGRKPEWKGDGFLQPLGRQEFQGVEQTVLYHKP